MTTDFQTNLYKFIADTIAQEGKPPAFAEMTAAMGISPRSKSLITRSLRALEKAGKLVLSKEGRRLHIALIPKQLPLLGRISAGAPIEAIEQHQFLDMQSLLGGANRFALHVKGNSMVEEGILDGDIIICQSAHTAREGDIVVALLDQNHTTLKRISYRMKGMITLLPANAELKPRAYAPERVHIQGIYIGLVRMNP